MKYLPKNTLAHWNAAPQVHRHDLSEMPVKVFATATKVYRQSCGQTFPHNDALTFYALNHCAAIVRKTFTPNEPLPLWAEQVMELYASVCNAQGKRMLHYVLSICAREMRWLQTKCTMTPEKWTQLKKAGGPAMVTFMKASPIDEDAAVERYMNQPPDVTVLQYIKAMSVGFHKMGWGGDGATSTGYGGPNWGNVADAAMSMLTGETSMEMLIDTGYTLAHNGGPIFNKGMMYYQYDSTLMTILDVQATGQVPDLVLDPEHSVQKTLEAKHAIKMVAEALPEEFKGYVNWFPVSELAPSDRKMSYEHLKSAQLKAHGPVKVVVIPPKPVAPVFKTFNGKKAVVKGKFAVFPGQEVDVVQRVEA